METSLMAFCHDIRQAIPKKTVKKLETRWPLENMGTKQDIGLVYEQHEEQCEN